MLFWCSVFWIDAVLVFLVLLIAIFRELFVITLHKGGCLLSREAFTFELLPGKLQCFSRCNVFRYVISTVKLDVVLNSD